MNKNLPAGFDISKPVSRAFGIEMDKAPIDEAKRTVDLSFSSEVPYLRSWGYEILDHSPGSMRLDRLKNGGPVLMDHDPTDHVGVIESVQNAGDRVGRAVLRFGKSVRASEVFQDVVDGIRKNVSVGYQIHDAKQEGQRDGVPVIRVTDWEPYEITLTSVPADHAVGVGRAADIPNITEKKMSEKTPGEIAAEQALTNERNASAARVTEAGTKAADIERKRVSEILAIGDQYAKYDVQKLAGDALRNGQSCDEFRAAILTKIATNPTPTNSDIGLTTKELRSYSLLRAFNHLADPGNARNREAASFEIECSQAGIQKLGRSIKGNFYMPSDIMKRQMPITSEMMNNLMFQRALNTGTATAGGNLVATELLTADFITLLRNAMVITGMGVRTLAGLQGNISIPRQSGGATAYWVAEGVAPSTSQQTFDQVALTPKIVGTYTDMTRNLLLQSSADVESLVQSDLAMVLGLAIQSAAIVGGGSGQPSGILATSGIGSVVGGANGLAPNWVNTVALETAVAVANADVGTLGYLTNAKVRGALKTTQKVDGANAAFIWDGGPQPLNGYRVGVTNAVPSNATKGTGTGLSTNIFGNFADLLIGMWGGLDILVDPYTNSTSGTVRIVVLQEVDVAVRHKESFAAQQDIVA